MEISNDDGRHPGIQFFLEAQVIDSDMDGSWEGEPEFVEKSEVENLEWELHKSHVQEYLFPDEKEVIKFVVKIFL